MKVNKSTGSFSRNGSLRSRRYTTSAANASYSSLPSPLPPKSPTINYQCTVDPPDQTQSYYKKSPSSPNCFPRSPRSPAYMAQASSQKSRSPSAQSERHAGFAQKSPSGQLSHHSTSSDHCVFNFPTTMDYVAQKSPILTPKSPRSPRTIHYESVESPVSSPPNTSSGSGNYFNFNLQSPPKAKLSNASSPASSKAYHTRQQYQSTKTDSSNSTKSSLEYASTKKHPNGDYQDIEYKVCNSVDSDSQPSSSVDFPTCVGYRYNSERRNARHPMLKENISNGSGSSGSAGGGGGKTKPKCNIRTNPGYDERYSSSKSINEYNKKSKKTHKSFEICRKSTSDLTDLTDEAANTTLTSLSRPSSPRRKGSVKSGLAYLASRRGSRDSVASNMSNVSNEDIGPLNFQNTARGRQRRTSNFLELPVPDHIRPRVCSLPEKAYNPRFSDDLYRLRTFSITNKGGVVNCGDSIINRRSKSNTSVNSTTSRASNVSGERSPFEGSCCGSGYHTVDSTPLGSPEEFEVPKYRVVMLGDSGVGKTALVSQFMTSEYMNTYDASLDDEFGERTVSILLDGEESEMIFIDHPSAEMSVENSLSTYEPHACVVVYSIVARSSFHHAEDTLNYLWREGYTQDKSVIVVGNKADLARSRMISANDGKTLAVSRECKFIETSSGIQHNVDELLVGILKQIRLRETRDKKKQATGSGSSKKESHNKLHGSKTSLSLNIAREILQKICLNDISKSKSCENLHVL